MSIVRGNGFVSLIDHAFTADLVGVLEETDPGFYAVITGGTMRATGAATLLTLAVPGHSDQDPPLAEVELVTFDMDDGETITIPTGLVVQLSGLSNPFADAVAGTALDINGGAPSCVLNGTIYFLIFPLASA